MILGNIDRLLSDNRASGALLDDAVGAFAAITWPHSLLAQVGTSRINRMLARLRNSPDSGATPRAVVDHFRTPLILHNANAGPEFTAWKPVLDRFSLADMDGPSSWAPQLRALHGVGIYAPTTTLATIPAPAYWRFPPRP